MGTAKVIERISWTRSYWVNEVEVALGEASIIWFEARIAQKNGKKVWAKKWASEFERELVRRCIHIAVHPVRRAFDRRVAFDEATAEMASTVERLRAHVEREFGKATGRHQRGLDKSDVRDFWRSARIARDLLAFKQKEPT